MYFLKIITLLLTYPMAAVQLDIKSLHIGKIYII